MWHPVRTAGEWPASAGLWFMIACAQKTRCPGAKSPTIGYSPVATTSATLFWLGGSLQTAPQ